MTEVINARALLSPDEKAWLYVISCDRFYKVGITENPERRMKQMMLHNPMEMKIVLYRTVLRRHVRYVEGQAHAYLQPWLHRGEWFTASLEEITTAVNMAMTKGRTREKRLQERMDVVLGRGLPDSATRGFYGDSILEDI